MGDNPNKYKSYKGADEAGKVIDTQVEQDEKELISDDQKMKEFDDKLKELTKNSDGSSDEADALSENNAGENDDNPNKYKRYKGADEAGKKSHRFHHKYKS